MSDTAAAIQAQSTDSLAELATHLKALPPAQRVLVLAEMRANKASLVDPRHALPVALARVLISAGLVEPTQLDRLIVEAIDVMADALLDTAESMAGFGPHAVDSDHTNRVARAVSSFLAKPVREAL